MACRFHRLGIYGHSAVYHENSDTIYVFGGFEYLTDRTIASGNLYALDLRRPAWSLLSPEENNKVCSSSDAPKYISQQIKIKEMVLLFHIDINTDVVLMQG